MTPNADLRGDANANSSTVRCARALKHPKMAADDAKMADVTPSWFQLQPCSTERKDFHLAFAFPPFAHAKASANASALKMSYWFICKKVPVRFKIISELPGVRTLIKKAIQSFCISRAERT